MGKLPLRVSVEKMPFLEFTCFMMTMSVYLFFRNKRAR